MEPKNTTDPHGLLTPNEAAQYLGISVDKLAKMRDGGEGPQFHTLNDVDAKRWIIRYKQADLDAWLDTRKINPAKKTMGVDGAATD